MGSPARWLANRRSIPITGAALQFDDWLLLIHIVAAATWLGAGIALFLLGRYAGRTGSESSIIRIYEWIGPRIGGPITVLIPVTGVWMVLRADSLEFTELWIILGMVLFVAMLVLAFGGHTPNYKRVGLAEENGDTTRLVRLARRGFALAGVEVAVLLVIFGVMVFKP
jgi:uncharacterized membrane protein